MVQSNLTSNSREKHKDDLPVKHLSLEDSTVEYGHSCLRLQFRDILSYRPHRACKVVSLMLVWVTHKLGNLRVSFYSSTNESLTYVFS